MSGKLVVIEGIDGSGGETQSKKLFEYLQKRGIPCERIAYPDYSWGIGETIHEWLHGKIELSPETLFLLYATDIVKDQTKIRSWLREGKIVISDRYITSTMAYQTLQGIPLETILEFCELFKIQKPDVILYLNISPKTSAKRKFEEKGNLDKNEANRIFLERVSQKYKELAKQSVFGSWFVVDAERSVEEVFEQIKRILRI